MTGITDLCHPETVRAAASHQAEARKIAAELAAIARTGMVLPGSLARGYDMNRSLATSSLPRCDQYEFLRKSAEVYFGGTGIFSRCPVVSSSRWRSQVSSHCRRLRSP